MIPEYPSGHDELHGIANLPVYEPEPACASLIRARCHAALASRRTRERVLAHATPALRLAFDCAATVVSAGFLAEVLYRALTLYGL